MDQIEWNNLKGPLLILPIKIKHWWVFSSGLSVIALLFVWCWQGGSCEIDSKSDKKDFADLRSAMEVLGFSTAEKDTILKILGSVLHLGNVYFNKVQVTLTENPCSLWGHLDLLLMDIHEYFVITHVLNRLQLRYALSAISDCFSHDILINWWLVIVIVGLCELSSCQWAEISNRCLCAHHCWFLLEEPRHHYAFI